MRLFLIALPALLLGGLIGWFSSQSINLNTAADSGEPEPLYWVAPMDPNYRRDGPGKSPMGMDLVPVYADSDNSNDDTGVVRISPAIENNLGVRTQPISRKALDPVIHTVGFVQYDENQLQHLHPRVAGWIDALYVTATGDPVTEGQKLYTLYSPELVNAQEDLLQAIKRGGDRLIAAAEERLRALQISQSVIDIVKRQGHVQQAVTFYAPASGVVDNLNVREGFYVEPGVQLMSIAGLSHVWVEAEVFARDAARVAVGAPVAMTLDFAPGRQWQGQVEYIYPSLDHSNHTLRLRVGFDNPEQHLKPGMYAALTIDAKHSGEQMITVPQNAVIRTGQMDRVVLALGEGRFKSVPVTLGASDSQRAAVITGLKDGDQVVTSVQFLLDSESSRDTDFARMVAPPEKTKPVQSAEVDGVINRIEPKTRMVNISRGAIEKWNRGPATLDFTLADPLDIGSIREGQTILFTFEIRDGEFVITELSEAQP